MEHVLNLTGLMVWCGGLVHGIIGPYFFNGNTTAESYLQVLEEMRAVLDNDDRFAGREMLFQLDRVLIDYIL